MITYLKGDATRPQATGPRLIAHVVNSEGGWGAGFVMALSRRWREPEWAYRAWAREGEHPHVVGKDKKFVLGNVQIVEVEPTLWVANMLAQEGYGEGGKPPIRYEELGVCLLRTSNVAEKLGASVHMPRIGCSLAGGSWAKVEPLIKRMMEGQQVFVYDFPGGYFNP